MKDDDYNVLNNKAGYSACGIVAGQALKKVERKYNHNDAQTVLKAVAVQMRVNEIEVKMGHAKVKIDEHNRKFSSNITLRNIEARQF
jgi:phage tail tube protein FII